MSPYKFDLLTSYLHYDYKNQVPDDLRRRARECDALQAEAKKSWSSVADFEKHRERMRANLLDAIGGLPQEKTPLNAQVTGVIEEEEFSIEKLHFESQPGYVVTANCYVPRNRQNPGPAVLFFCGHTKVGKGAGYQKICRALASNGFLVLVIDPLGQGERLQYVRDGVNTQYSNTAEHSYSGLPFVVQGANVARHFVWDAMRAMDYLVERGDVDPERIGAVGNSGGGTQTALFMLLEERLAAAMPCTWITSLRHMMLTGWAQDMEQITFGGLVRGPDHDDFLTGIAPRPVMLGLAAYDPFPIEGSLQSYERAKAAYELYGQGDAMEVTIDPCPHGFSAGLRHACVRFFQRALQPGTPEYVPGDPIMLPDEELHATANGQVWQDFPDCRTIYDLNCELLEASPLPPQRSREELREVLTQALALPKCGSRSDGILPRLRERTHEGHRVEETWFFSAPDIIVAGLLIHPDCTEEMRGRTVLLLLEGGTSALDGHMPLLEKWLGQNQPVFVFDPRGVGAVATRTENASEAGHQGDPTFPLTYPFFTTEFKLGCDAMLLGLSLLGLRVFDVLRGFDYLTQRPDTRGVEIYAAGKASISGYFAACLEPGVEAVTCVDMLASYRGFCQTRFYDATRFNLDILPWGMLRHGDIQDFLPCLAARSLQLIDPRDGENKLLPATHWAQNFSQPNLIDSTP